ncbi:MAG: hypothetical protein Q8L57_00850 [bacterium]|nr:hypothetical protein [bacterium]
MKNESKGLGLKFGVRRTNKFQLPNLYPPKFFTPKDFGLIEYSLAISQQRKIINALRGKKLRRVLDFVAKFCSFTPLDKKFSWLFLPISYRGKLS